MILEKIKADNLTARKSKDKFTSGILTTLIGEIEMVGKNAGNRAPTDAEAVKVITKFQKGTKENINLIMKRENTRGIIALEDEFSLYEKYLPKQFDEDELHLKISKIINDISATSMKDMGNIMKTLKERYAGLYDGKLASKLIKEILS